MDRMREEWREEGDEKAFSQTHILTPDSPRHRESDPFSSLGVDLA